MKKREIAQLDETIESYEDIVNIKGIKSLSIEEIETYRDALEKKSNEIRKNIIKNRINTAVMAALSAAAVGLAYKSYQIGLSLSPASVTAVTSVAAIGGASFGLLAGINTTSNINNFYQREQMKDQILRINQELLLKQAFDPLPEETSNIHKK